MRLTLGCFVAVLGIAACRAAAQASADPSARAQAFHKTVGPILSNYCSDCHFDGSHKGNVALDQFKSDNQLLGDHDLWWLVLKNVRAGLMPPHKHDQPSAEEKQRLVDWIKYDAFGIDPSNVDPGRVTIRRLNRVEYRNTIRDLMGVDYNTTEEFPPDDTGYGFDTVGDVLSISPLLLEKYMQAAQTIVKEAVPTVGKVPPERLVAGKRFHSKAGDATAERLSFYKPAALTAQFRADRAGEYQFIIEVSVLGEFDFDPGRCDLTLNADDHKLLSQEFKWYDHKTLEYQAKATLDAGEHTLALDLKPVTPDAQRKNSLYLKLDSVRVQGPMDPKFWKLTPNYSRFFPREEPPASAADRLEYAKQVLRAFAGKAFRRPDFGELGRAVDERTVDRLAKLAESVYSRPGRRFEEGVRQAMVAVLSSPRFLFRVEQPVADSSGERFPLIDEYSLASRLSYFLWSTMPDEQLMDLARRGELRKNLNAQLTRMLADPRSEQMVKNFVGQWLQVRDVQAINIDSRVVLAQDSGQGQELEREIAEFRKQLAERQKNPNAPRTRIRRPRLFNAPTIELDGQLRGSIQREVYAYFSHVVHEDCSVLELLDSHYTFLNERLAKYYGIKGVSGDRMRLVELPDDNPRGGLLTMASTLMVTSNPTRTSPVKRGQFILDNVLGMPAPPPPANIPPLEASEAAFKDKAHPPSFREVLEVHRSKPLCSSCHSRMDPLGLSLENFDALGLWRQTERGQPIDASGKLITGESFHDVRDLKRILKDDHKLDFYRCLTEKLLTYALGRGLGYDDVETVDQIVDRLDHADGRFSALLEGVIESAPFQRERAAKG